MRRHPWSQRGCPVGVRIVEAEPDVARWLSWVSAPSRSTRWLVKGVWYERERDGESGYAWVRRHHEPDRPANGRTPDICVSEAAVAGYARLAEAEAEAETSLVDALKGEVPSPVRDIDGNERVEWRNIRLKNADGTLTRAAKNLREVHGKRARIERDANAHLHGTIEKVKLVDMQGRQLEVPVRLADRIAKQRGLKPLKKRARGRTYLRSDGSKVKLVREGGGIVEVSA